MTDRYLLQVETFCIRLDGPHIMRLFVSGSKDHPFWRIFVSGLRYKPSVHIFFIRLEGQTINTYLYMQIKGPQI